MIFLRLREDTARLFPGKAITVIQTCTAIPQPNLELLWVSAIENPRDQDLVMSCSSYMFVLSLNSKKVCVTAKEYHLDGRSLQSVSWRLENNHDTKNLGMQKYCPHGFKHRYA